MDIPKHHSKISGRTLIDTPSVALDDFFEIDNKSQCLYYRQANGYRYDFLFCPKDKADKIFVLFSGDAVRGKNDPPVFQRWSWSNHFPGHVIYVSDPSLYLHDDLGLAWYAGTNETDHLEVISSVIKVFSEKLKVETKNIVAYGSSGGGFASLRLVNFIEDITSVAINPQVDVTKYWRKVVEKYFDICFEGRSRNEMLRDFPGRISLLDSEYDFSSKKIIYVQNELDEHHYELHLKPFYRKVTGGEVASDEHELFSGDCKFIVFSDEGGHSRAEPPEVFAKILELLD